MAVRFGDMWVGSLVNDATATHQPLLGVRPRKETVDGTVLLGPGLDVLPPPNKFSLSINIAN